MKEDKEVQNLKALTEDMRGVLAKHQPNFPNTKLFYQYVTSWFIQVMFLASPSEKDAERLLMESLKFVKEGTPNYIKEKK